MKSIKIYVLILMMAPLSVLANITGWDIDQKLETADSLMKLGASETAIEIVYHLEFKVTTLKNLDSVAMGYFEIAKWFKRNYIEFKAVKLCQKVIHLYPENNKELIVAHCYLMLGGIHYNNNDYEHAEIFWNKSLPHYANLNNHIGESNALNNLGEIYKFKGELNNAIDFYYKSLNLKKLIADHRGQLINHINISELYLQLDQIDSALVHTHKAEKIANEFENFENIISANISRSRCLIYKNQDDEAEAVLLNTLNTIDEKNNLHAKKTVYNYLIQIAEKRNNIKQLSQRYKQYLAILKEINDNKRMVQSLKLENEYIVQQKDKEIDYLSEKAKIEERANRQKQRLYLIIIGIILILSILMFLVFKLRNKNLIRKNQLIEDEKIINLLEIEKKEAEHKQKEVENKLLRGKVAHKNKELSMATLHVINKNESLSKLLTQLDDFSEKSVRLVKLRNEIKASLDLDKNWEQFKVHFESVHENFFSQLKTNYPNLSTEEFRLCAYLRINLTSKEIAQILNIQSSAVNKRRNRLRKKLNIEGEDHLTLFLSEI